MRTQLISVTKILALAVMAVSTSSVFAQSAGDTVVTAGWFHIMPQDSSTPIRVLSPIQTTLEGSGATVETADTLGFTVTRFLTDNVAVALDLGIPPTYKLNGTGSLAAAGRLGTAKQWAPALLAKYYFGEANSQFRPWLGLGVTRVNYTNVELTKSFQGAVGAKFGSPTAVTTADLGISWAPVFNAGLSYAINKNWSANFSVSYLKLKTTANLTTNPTAGPLAGQSVRSTTTLTLDPIVTYLSVGYRF